MQWKRRLIPALYKNAIARYCCAGGNDGFLKFFLFEE
jgi:hypothetical protein